MKTLTFTTGAETAVGLSGCDDVAIAWGADGFPRIAAHLGKEVWFTRLTSAGWVKQLVAKASTDHGSNLLPVVDVYGITIASSPYGDVVAGRGRTKGQADQTYHGPWMTVIPPVGNAGPIQFKGFTEGACRCIFDNPAKPYAVELWSKDGNWQTFDVRNVIVSPKVDGGKDPCTGTGEKLCMAAGGWRGFSGYSKVKSAAVRRGTPAVVVMDTGVYNCGDDTNWPGLGVNGDAAYYLLALGGRLLVNKVAQGAALFAPGSLPSIGPANTLERHSPAAVAVRRRMAAVWTAGGQIMAIDVDGALASLSAPCSLCSGSMAAACAAGTGIAMAVIRSGQVYFSKVTTTKA